MQWLEARSLDMPESEVRLFENSRGVLSVLEIRTLGRRSSLETVRGLLFDMRVQIVRAESIVEESGLHECFQIVEFAVALTNVDMVGVSVR
jgi:hypothetical protein